ncbi:hypothetical protein [Xylanimonas sp. McL0601]|uniref:hypothetical protein n=1 Tax=Xylanimonas sp. McL0601 TaxID=3414739 RepID=UPI003CE84C58
MSEHTFVFLDAPVIAKPVTRTLLMVARSHSDFTAVWSLRAEQQAAIHRLPNAAPLPAVRDAYRSELTPPGAFPERFTGTKQSVRTDLADAEAAGAHYLITADVYGFGLSDLAIAGLSAVTADLFLAERMTSASYMDAIELFSQTQSRPRRTLEQLHAAIAVHHPQLFAAHADLYDVGPLRLSEPPEQQFWGLRCVRCGAVTMRAEDPHRGVCPACLHAASVRSRESVPIA